MKTCKRGNIAARDKSGHCLCNACKAFRNKKVRENVERKKYVIKWRNENKDKISKYSKKWIENNIEQRGEIEKKWKTENPEKVKEYNKKSGKKWSENNKGKRNAITAKRRSCLLQRTPTWADLDKIKAFYIQAELLTQQSGIEYEVDHIIPLQGENISGLHVHNNLQIITRSENRRKRNKTPFNIGGL